MNKRKFKYFPSLSVSQKRGRLNNLRTQSANASGSLRDADESQFSTEDELVQVELNEESYSSHGTLEDETENRISDVESIEEEEEEEIYLREPVEEEDHTETSS